MLCIRTVAKEKSQFLREGTMASTRSFLACSVFVFAFPAIVQAASVCEGSSNEEVSRALIEKRKKYESDLSSLEQGMRTRQVTFKKCTSQKWRTFWQPRLVEAESAHAELRKQRSELMKLRQSIERDPGPIRVVEYCPRMEHEVFYGYDEYFSGIKSYFAFIDASIDLCNRGEYGEGAAEMALSYIDRILEAVEKIGGIFKILRG